MVEEWGDAQAGCSVIVDQPGPGGAAAAGPVHALPAIDEPPALEELPAQPDSRQPSNRSSTTAIPSSSLEDVTSSATAFSSSCASAIATPYDAQANIGRSLGMSPKAIVSAAFTPRRRAASDRPVAFNRPSGSSSTMPWPAIATETKPPAARTAACANSSSDSSGCWM